MDKDLERLLYLHFQNFPINEEYEQLESKLNEKLEKSQYCEEHHKIYETRCAPEKKRPTLKEQDQEQQIKQLKEENSILKQGVFKDHEEIQSLKSQLTQLSSMIQDKEQIIIDISRQNEKLQKVIDKIKKEYNLREYAESSSNSSIALSERLLLKSILSEAEK